METIVTSIPMLILAAIAYRGVFFVVVFLKGILPWMKIATPPCSRLLSS